MRIEQSVQPEPRAARILKSTLVGRGPVNRDVRRRASTHRFQSMPTVLRVCPYRFFFYAGDRDEPPHVKNV